MDLSTSQQPKTWMRAHGLPVTDVGHIRDRLPGIGMFEPERHHPWFGRVNLPILLGKKCNHDVNVMIRAVPSAFDASADSAALLHMMIGSMKTLTQYVTAYTTITQPHAENLWRALQTNIARLEDELHASQPDAAEPEGGCDPGYRVQRVLMRLATTVHKRCHRSLQEAVGFLLDEPEAYCYHRFTRVYFTNAMRVAGQMLEAPLNLGAVPMEPEHTAVLSFGSTLHPSQPHLTLASQHIDYEHRGTRLQAWPWYFYIASVSRVKIPAATTDVEDFYAFADTHPSPNGCCQRIRSQSAWTVPQLAGPSFPSASSDAERQALMLLLLFRPWIGPVGSILRISDAHPQNLCSSWTQALRLYRCELEHLRHTNASAEFPTPAFWAARTLRVMDNILNWTSLVPSTLSQGVRTNPDAASGCPDSVELPPLCRFCGFDASAVSWRPSWLYISGNVGVFLSRSMIRFIATI